MLRGDAQRYGPVARAFHWMCALLFLFLVALGAWMTELDYYDALQPAAIRWHRSIGIALLAIVVARLVWRFADRRPAPHPQLRPWERNLSVAAHFYLLFVLLALPVTGYFFSASKGDSIPLIAGIALPSALRIGTEAAERIYDLHWLLAYSGLAVAFLHAAGAFKHLAEGNAEILRRMIGGPVR